MSNNSEVQESYKNEINSEKVRKPWKILLSAIKGLPRENVYGHIDASIRAFNTFDLFTKNIIISPLFYMWNTDGDIDRNPGKWHTYRPTDPAITQYNCNLKTLTGSVNLKDLVDFDNTGNVCIWSSEEILAYFALKNLDKFIGATVCELGCGMTGFAGMILASTNKTSRLLLTDGNKSTIHNCNVCIQGNKSLLNNSCIEASVLEWGKHETCRDLESIFDVVIAADCLFYTSLHDDLIETINFLLKPKTGEAIILAPHRGESLLQFCENANTKFKVEIVANYDDHIWAKKCEYESKPGFDYNLHYPILVRLKKYK